MRVNRKSPSFHIVGCRRGTRILYAETSNYNPNTWLYLFLISVFCGRLFSAVCGALAHTLTISYIFSSHSSLFTMIPHKHTIHNAIKTKMTANGKKKTTKSKIETTNGHTNDTALSVCVCSYTLYIIRMRCSSPCYCSQIFSHNFRCRKIDKIANHCRFQCNATHTE